MKRKQYFQRISSHQPEHNLVVTMPYTKDNSNGTTHRHQTHGCGPGPLIDGPSSMPWERAVSHDVDTQPHRPGSIAGQTLYPVMVSPASIHGLAWRSLASPGKYLEVTGPGSKSKRGQKSLGGSYFGLSLKHCIARDG
ncbi:hypothetical protein V495_04594 [Pseudogymnoascus sp. VKM F-4514 (FW-929)]|nr:hypothetical protein V495_04594 [Pseudogymnoascus sp. VKM F-4514 (FW-929)]KFY53685.1 hypothetical protein V497_08304 [Pseudogymnoascus sp. VKM F-4516 (FW-969)]